MPAFFAEAGFLDAAERRFRRGDEAFIDPDHTVFQPFHHSEGAAEVTGVEVAGKAEFGVVGEGDGFLFGLELEHRCDRAKDLFLHEAHLGCRVGDDRRLEERTAERMALAAGNDLAAL